MVLGEDKAHGTSSVTSVGPPGGLDTLIVPSNAASRRITPRMPVPAAGIGAAAAVVADDHAEQPASRRGVSSTQRARRRRACRCWPGTRRRRSRRPTPPAPAAGRRGPAVTDTGTAMSSASACTAPASPRSASTGGWMPRTTDRRSPSAAPVVAAPRAGAAGRRSGSRAHSSSAMPRLIRSATSRACAPSCRSRSIRRSSAAEWSTRLGAGLGQHPRPAARAARCARGSASDRSSAAGRHDRRRAEPPQRPRHDQHEQQHHEQREREADGGGDQPRRGRARSSGRRPRPRRRSSTAPSADRGRPAGRGARGPRPAIARCRSAIHRTLGAPPAGAGSRRPRAPSRRRPPPGRGPRSSGTASSSCAGRTPSAAAGSRRAVRRHAPILTDPGASATVGLSPPRPGSGAPDRRPGGARLEHRPDHPTERSTVMTADLLLPDPAAGRALERHAPVARDRRLAGWSSSRWARDGRPDARDGGRRLPDRASPAGPTPWSWRPASTPPTPRTC